MEVNQLKFKINDFCYEYDKLKSNDFLVYNDKFDIGIPLPLLGKGEYIIRLDSDILSCKNLELNHQSDLYLCYRAYLLKISPNRYQLHIVVINTQSMVIYDIDTHIILKDDNLDALTPYQKSNHVKRPEICDSQSIPTYKKKDVDDNRNNDYRIEIETKINDGIDDTFLKKTNAIRFKHFKQFRAHWIIFKSMFNVAPVLTPIGGMLYTQLLLIGLMVILGIEASVIQHVVPSGWFNIVLQIIALIIPYMIMEWVVSPVLIRIAQKIWADYKGVTIVNDYATQSYFKEVTPQYVRRLNDIVEFENDPNVAHRLYECIDLEQSYDNTLMIDHTQYGQIVDQVPRSGELSPKHLAMKNHVLSEEINESDVDDFMDIITNYHEAKANLEYQREYDKYDEVFSKASHHQTSPLDQSLHDISDTLKCYNDEIEQLMQDKMKDTNERIEKSQHH